MDIALAKDIANLILTLVLTGETVLLAIYSWRLVDETRSMRKEQVRPNISVYFEQAETDPTLMFIVVENNGHGTAYDLRFKVTAPIKSYRTDDETDTLANIGLFKHGMKYCPAGFRKKYLLMETTSDYDKKMAEVLKLTVSYKDGFKKDIHENFTIATIELALSSKITPSDTHIGRVAEGIADLNKTFERLMKGLEKPKTKV